MIVPTVEIMPSYHRHNITHALFDFDGTLSLIRDGWSDIMFELFVQQFGDVYTEDEDVLHRNLRKLIAETTGLQTIIQMEKFRQVVLGCCSLPATSEEYKAEFVRRLEKKMEAVIFGLTTGDLQAEDYRVKKCAPTLFAIRQLGIETHLFSGTDQKYVERDAALIGLLGYFQNRIHGATPDLQTSSKKAVIQKVLNENRITGDNLVVFGDGMVEILEAKAVGALAVGVASREGHNGERDEAKRNRLVEAGADLIITDYQKFDLWMPLILGT